MTRVAVLSADLVANSTRFESGLKSADRAMARSRQNWATAIDRSNRSFSTMEMSVGRATQSLVGMQTAIRGVAAAAIGGLSVQSVVRYSDAFTTLFTQIGNFTSSASEQRRVFDDLFTAAQRTGNGIEGLAQTFARLSGSLPDTLRQSYNLVDVTELLARGFSAAGATAQTTEGALLQLSQGLATNFKAAGQELNSFIEGAPALAKIIAKQLGGESAVDLKRFATEGKLTAQTFLDALMRSREAIEAFELPATVGRSIERVRNSLIRLAGDSEVVQVSARTLAESIDYLADNIDVVVRLGAAFAVLMGGRMLSSLVAVTAAQVRSSLAAASQAAAYNSAATAAASSARMQAALATAANAAAGSMSRTTIVVGQTGKAVLATSTALGTAAVAARGLYTALLTLTGGPIGLALAAIAGATYLLSTRQTELKKAVEEGAAAQSEAARIAQDLATAHGETAKEAARAREETLRNAQASIVNAREKLKEAQAIYEVIKAQNQRAGAGGGFAGAFGPGAAGANVAEAEAALQKRLDTLKELQRTFGEGDFSSGGGGGGSSGGGSTAKDKIEEIIKALDRENAALGRSIELYGQKGSVIDAANKRAEIANQLADTNQKLTAAQREELEKLLGVYTQQTAELERQKEATDKAKEADEERKRVMDSLFSNFNSNLEDAIVNGGKLSDVLQGLVQDFIRALVRANITAPLVQAAQGSSFFSGIADLFTGILPSFAVGTNYVPYDMTANIHKGEMIIPASEAAALRSGKGGGSGNVTVNVINNGNSKVQTQSRETENGVQLDVMIDQITARNASKPGTLTNQALTKLNSRSLTKR